MTESMKNSKTRQTGLDSNFSCQSTMSDKPKSDELVGKLYELALFMYILTQKIARSKNLDIGKEVKMADKFDDLVIKLNENDIEKFICIQSKLVDNPEKDLIDADVLTGEKSISLHENDFDLRKYFKSYLRIKDQLESRNQDQSSLKGKKSILKTLVIWTNAKPNLNKDKTLLIQNQSTTDSIGSLIPETNKGKLYYKINHNNKALKEHLKKDIKSDLEILSEEFVKYVTTECQDHMVLDKDYFNYYHTALVDEKVIEFHEVQQGKKTIKKGNFTHDFVNDTNLSDRARMLRKSIALKLNSTNKVNEQNITESLRKAVLPISNDFGVRKNASTKIYLPNYKIENKSFEKFFHLLEIRLDQSDVKGLFNKITYEKIKEAFLSYYDTDPRFILHIVRDYVEKLKNTKESIPEIWILNSEKKQFIQELETNISKPKSKHKTWEYVKFLEETSKRFDLYFNDSCSLNEKHFPADKQLFFIKTESILLSSIKMVAYLNRQQQQDYIFINLESLVKKQEIQELIKAFQDNEFNKLILSYNSSVDDELQQELFCDLFKMMKSNQKRIILITSSIDDTLIGKFKNEYASQNKYKEISDTFTLEHLNDHSKILQEEITLQDQPIALNKLVTLDKDSIKLIDAKTIENIILGKGKEIKIDSKPLGINDLEGSYAELFEEINTATLTKDLVDNLPDSSIYIISQMYIKDRDSSKKRFVNNLKFPAITINENKRTINSKINILTDPYSIPSTVETMKTIQLVDSKFKENDFKKLCHGHSDKEIHWIKQEESKFILQKIYNPNFYINRQFYKLIINKKKYKHGISEQNIKDYFVFSGISNCSDLENLLELKTGQLDDNMIFVTHDTNDARKKFDELSGTVHWLEVKNNGNDQEIVWRNSKGKVGNIRDYINENKTKNQAKSFVKLSIKDNEFLDLIDGSIDENQTNNLRNEKELLDFIEDKQVVIIADDPGMGKSTSLVKLCQSKCDARNRPKIVDSQWVISVYLRRNLEVIKNIDINNINIAEFLSEVGENLKEPLCQRFLKLALDPEKKFHKPLLITFDGFDEVLDQKNKDKVISLLKDLKVKTKTKFWVTTRLQDQIQLEDALSTFAVKFDPLDEEAQIKFINKYLKNRSRLLLSEEDFVDVFGSDEETVGDVRIWEYSEGFIKKMQSVFKKDISRFIGTPLQIHLLLGASKKEDSKSHIIIKNCIGSFRYWVSSNNEPDFSYIGETVLKVYENFINGQYETYFKKMGISEDLEKPQKYVLNRYCEHLTKKLMFSLNEKLELEFLEQYKSTALSFGLIKSEGNDLTFIHQTFKEYFVSKICMDWIEQESNEEIDYSGRQRKLLEKILMDENDQVIRSFLNDRLKDKQLEKKVLNSYGELIQKMWNLTEDPQKGYTQLHIAIEEGNANIVNFLLSSLSEYPDSCKKFLFMKKYDDHEINALHTATLLYADNAEVVKELLINADKVGCKVDLVMSQDYKGRTALFFAFERDNTEIASILLDEFKDDKDNLTKLLLISCHNDPYLALDEAIFKENLKLTEKLLSTAKNIGDDLKTLKSLMTPNRGGSPLHAAAVAGSVEMVTYLLDFAKDISLNFLTELILHPDYSGSTALQKTVTHGGTEIISFLLEKVITLDPDNVDNLIFHQNREGNNVIYLMCENGYEGNIEKEFKSQLVNNGYEDIWNKIKNELSEVPLKVKLACKINKLVNAAWKGDVVTMKNILEKYQGQDQKSALRTLLLGHDGYCTFFHTALKAGHNYFAQILLIYAKNIDDNWETFNELLSGTDMEGNNPFETAEYKTEVNEMIKIFLGQARDVRAPEETIQLLENIKQYLENA